MTAFYTGRAFFMTFWGPEKLPSPDDPEAPRPSRGSGHGDHEPHGHGPGRAHGHGHGHHDVGHESPPIMTYPADGPGRLCACWSGLVFGPTHWFEHHLEQTLGLRGAGHTASTASTGRRRSSARSPACSGIGLATASTPSRARSPAGWPAGSGRSTRRRSTSSTSMRSTTGVVVRPTRAVAIVCEFLDVYLVDSLVRGIAWLPRMLGEGPAGRLSERPDPVLRGGLGARRGGAALDLLLV